MDYRTHADKPEIDRLRGENVRLRGRLRQLAWLALVLPGLLIAATGVILYFSLRRPALAKGKRVEISVSLQTPRVEIQTPRVEIRPMPQQPAMAVNADCPSRQAGRLVGLGHGPVVIYAPRYCLRQTQDGNL